MHEYLIEGGFPIKGTITACGNNNGELISVTHKEECFRVQGETL